jgi:hypothetical protein
MYMTKPNTTPAPALPEGTQPAAKVAVKAPAKRPAAKKAAPVRKIAAKSTTKTTAKKAAAAPKVKQPAAKQAAKAPATKVKLVRDSFTMPEADFALIATLKATALEFKRPTKKSELLRAGLQALAQLKPAQLQSALSKLPAIKTGRPKKADKASK